jgi:hypothetical protein
MTIIISHRLDIISPAEVLLRKIRDPLTLENPLREEIIMAGREWQETGRSPPYWGGNGGVVRTINTFYKPFWKLERR